MDDLNHYEMSIPRHIDMTTMSMEEVPPEEVATLLLLVSSTVSIFIDIAACCLLAASSLFRSGHHQRCLHSQHLNVNIV
jgi:hypothetical protein